MRPAAGRVPATGCFLMLRLPHHAGPNYPYDYNRLGSWDNSYQQINTSNYYDAQKHAFLQKGTQGWFQWNYRIYGDNGEPARSETAQMP